MINKISDIFYAGIDENTSDNDVRKYVLLNILILVTSLILFVFIIVNIFLKENYTIVIVDTLGLLANIYAFYGLKKKKKLETASILVTLNAFFLLMGVTYFGEAKNFILIWVIFFPVFAIFINGCKKGFVLSIIFYAIVFFITYTNIGIWLDGAWTMASFARFVAANLGMLFITYFFERSFEAAHNELAKNREIEQNYITALEHASITDPLTQLYNRRHLDYLFHEQFEKAKAHRSYFALFVLDLDFFKGYNDTYGHIAGDDALKKVADVLKESMRREADSAFRLGGEEFAGIVMADSQEKIQKSVERVRESIETLKIEHEKSSHEYLTASIGVCIIHDFAKEDFDRMYKIADDALYKAKQEGRNCVRGSDKISTL